MMTGGAKNIRIAMSFERQVAIMTLMILVLYASSSSSKKDRMFPESGRIQSVGVSLPLSR
jgi:hypothetical protein